MQGLLKLWIEGIASVWLPARPRSPETDEVVSLVFKQLGIMLGAMQPTPA
jgi:hypothetical protein